MYNNKLAIVTGGSEGIGREVVKEFVKAGANVIAVSRSKEKLSAAQKEFETLRVNKEQKILVESIDVSNFSEVQKAMDQLVQNYGTPDFLINCAGFARPGYIQNLGIEWFHKMMDVNYFGIVNTCKALVPHMVTAMKGQIVNCSSMAGFIGLFGYTGYCGSKWAVVGFSEALRRELEPYNIQVSVLCPPNTRTPGLDEENKFKPREVLAAEEKAKTVNPDFIAKSLMKALPKNSFMIVPTFDGTMAYYLSRYLPSVLNQFVKRPE